MSDKKVFHVGEKWITRDGRIATITEVRSGVPYPIIGRIDPAISGWGDNMKTWASDGQWNKDISHDRDLIERFIGDDCRTDELIELCRSVLKPKRKQRAASR